MEDFSESDHQLLSDEIKHLQQIHRVVEAVIAEMSFEVRTPAATVVGYADLLLNELIGPINEEQRKALTQVNDDSRYVLKVWNELMFMSRVLLGQLRLQPVEVDFCEVIQEAISATWEYWRFVPGGVQKPKIEQRIPKNLPKIWIDVFLLQQAVMWIIVTSIMTMYQSDNGKIDFTGYSNDNDSLTFTVTTTSKELLQYSDDYPPELFMSRIIIERHRGQLEIVRKEEYELVFGVTLPIDLNKPLESNDSNRFQFK